MSAISRPLWRELSTVGLLSALANLLMLVPVLYMLQVYDRVLVSFSEGTLLAVSLLALLLLAAMAFSEALRSRVLVGTGVRLERVFGARVFAGSFGLALESRRGEAVQALADFQQVRQFITGPGVFAFFDAPWAPLYIAVCFLLHPWLGVLALVFAGAQVLLAWAGHRGAAGASRRAGDAALAARAGLTDPLRSAATVEALGMLAAMRRRWQQRQSLAVLRQARAQDLTQRIAGASKFLRQLQQSLALAAGAWLVISGELTPGAMIAATLLIGRALAPVDALVGQWRLILDARSALARLRTVLAAAEPATPRAGHAGTVRGAVQLRAVRATSADGGRVLLRDVSLDIAPGQTVVVVGPSGAGKSTLVRCLLGLWPRTEGELLIDGVPVQAWDRDVLGPQLGYLPQDVQLFEGTVADNIARMARPDASKVVAAARATGLHEAILRLPAGYDTPVGAAGGMLSGGQRQRLGLARALHGDPALVVLDEPNAWLDKDGERALAETLKELRRNGRTVVLVAQRLSSFQFADRVLVLRDGAVAAWGPPSAAFAHTA